MGKPTFSVNYPYTNIAPATVEFTSTPQMDSEEIYLFDFGDGSIYVPDVIVGEEYPIKIIRHTYKNAGTYWVKAIAIDHKTMSDPVPVTITKLLHYTLWERFIAWLKRLFEYI